MRNINDLHPTLIDKVYELIDLCEKNGITIAISECVRTVAEQDALYAKGRTAAGKIVTNAKGSGYKSMHQWGVAFDFYLKMDIDGDGQTADDAYNNATKMFDKVGALGQSIGLEWGGSWKSPVDKCHFQLPDWGSTTAKLLATYKNPDAFRATWATTEQPTTVETSPSGVATCTASSGLTVRSGIGKVNGKVTAIPYKKECKLLQLNAGTADGLTWARVSYGGKTGFCAQKYLNVVSEPKADKTTNSASTDTTTSGDYSKNVVEAAKVKNAGIAGTYKTAANLNLRTGAGTGKGVITTIPAGSEVQNYGYYSISAGAEWYLVAYGKQTGYCAKKYLAKA